MEAKTKSRCRSGAWPAAIIFVQLPSHSFAAPGTAILHVSFCFTLSLAEWRRELRATECEEWERFARRRFFGSLSGHRRMGKKLFLPYKTHCVELWRAAKGGLSDRLHMAALRGQTNRCFRSKTGEMRKRWLRCTSFGAL